MAKQKQKRSRTYARNRAAALTRRGNEVLFETDSTYFLKLVVFVLLGTLWVKFSDPLIWMGFQFNAIPVGMLVGLLLVNKFEKYQSDRKIWYAILLVVTIICYFVPAGVIL
jgi:hypothetical protein